MNPTIEGSPLYWAELARNWASAFTFLAALLAGIFGLYRYARSERMRQTEQVRELYKMFFDNERYRHIRFVLASPDSPEMTQLKRELVAGGIPGALEGQLIDLLNFLEFAAGLTRRGLVARADIDWMFDSFIQRVIADPDIRTYVLRQTYEELHKAARLRERTERRTPRQAAA